VTNAFSAFGHPTGILMPQRELPREPHVLLHHVEIRMADSRPANPDQYLASTNLRFWDVRNKRRTAHTLKAYCLHISSE
jgi:hypothetical protein